MKAVMMLCEALVPLEALVREALVPLEALVAVRAPVEAMAMVVALAADQHRALALDRDGGSDHRRCTGFDCREARDPEQDRDRQTYRSHPLASVSAQSTPILLAEDA
jgi:hypothetical protein